MATVREDSNHEEEVDELIDDDQEEEDEFIHSVRLTDGLDMQKILRGEGDCFTLNLDDHPDSCSKAYFDPEAIFSPTSESSVPGWSNKEDDNDDDNESGDDSPFATLTRKMELLTKDEDGQIYKKIKKAGFGLKVTDEAHVAIHYSGFTEYADEPFDSTRMQVGMKRFQIGSGDVIMGIDVAVRSMKKGEIAEFLFSPDYGFGPTGCPPRIPPDATLFFEIELIDFNTNAGANDYYAMTFAERKQAGFAVIKPMTDTEKKKGNSFFKRKRYFDALRHYRKAIKILEECRLADEADERVQQKALLTLYHNAALASENQGRHREAIYFCNNALNIQKGCAKSHYIKGKALCYIGEFDRARKDLLIAQRKKPNDTYINQQLETLARLQKKTEVNEITLYQRMFGIEDTPKKSEEVATSGDDDDGDCTEDFKETVVSTLKDFMSDNSEMMSFKFNDFTDAERSCIEKIGKDLGLEFDKGTNSYQIKKPTK